MINGLTSKLSRGAAAVVLAVSLGWSAVGPDAALAAGGGATVRHLRLVSSSPAADEVVAESPSEIRLVFSEAPQAAASVRLTRGAEDLVPTTETAADPQDARRLTVHPESPLVAGAYTTHWRVISRDGHAVRGTFGFEVAAAD